MNTIFDILRRPIVTEKTNYQSTGLHQYTFEVKSDATRTMVKEAIEQAFKVTVLKVNVINVPAKRTRRARSRRMAIRNSGYKKAVVTLAAEDRIPIFEGVE
ncbi:MAG: 50S ribosomal protein L23 [Anaerolineaceae bacterium]|jgi:large subunit ribosomal protein L23